MTYFYNTQTEAIITYSELKNLYPMFSWPAQDNGYSVDARLEMSEIHPDILQYKRLHDLEKPVAGRYEKVDRVDPVYQNNRWEWGWNVRPATTQEIEQIKENLINEMKSYRDESWQNADIELSNGAILQINERTRRDVSDTFDGLITAGMEEYTGWNAVNGVYTMALEDFQEAKIKALARVKQSFDAYNYIVSQNDETPYTDDSWKSDFDNQLGA